MTAFERIPSYIDTARILAETAAELAGYDLNTIKDRQLFRSFIDKGFQAAGIIGPAEVVLDADGVKVPDDVRLAGKARGLHMIAIAREWRGLSVEDLAERSGLSKALIVAIESFHVASNEMHDAAIGKVLDINPNALTDWSALVPADV